MNMYLGSSSISLDKALTEFVRIESLHFASPEKPDIDSLKKCVLRQGQRAYKAALYWTIRDRHTHLVHHHQLTLLTLHRTKRRGWEQRDKNTITLSDHEGNEIGRLFDFLATEASFNANGTYIVVNANNVDEDQVLRVLNAALTSDNTVAVLGEIVKWIDTEPFVTEGLIKIASNDPLRSRSLVAALNFGRYSQAVDDLSSLVEGNHKEYVYQKFLEENYWMFGSEYSELISSRNFLAAQQLDFPLRRTVDGYLEIIEIKRPMNGTLLFRRDKRGNLTEIAELVESIAQVDDYLANIDSDRNRIVANLHLESEKVRAKIVIGRDGDEEHSLALRRLNARMVRIEIITYDQLLRIAARVLQILASENSQLDSDISSNMDSMADIPF